MATDPRIQRRAGADRIGLSVVGTIFFFVASLVLAYNAGRAHAAGARMSTGDGSISPNAAYGIAAALFLMAIVYALRTRSLLRKRPPR